MFSLRRARAIVTGAPVALFMAGLWRRDGRSQPGAMVLDVLCHTFEAREVLRRMLEQSGYRVSKAMCRHNLGEWRATPQPKRVCLVRGSMMQRVVHLIELPRPVVETVVSRAYGSMAGVYLTGGGKAVSLFPHISLVERRLWLPKTYTKRERAQVAAKYPGWNLTSEEDGVPLGDVKARKRSPGDGRTRWSYFNPATGKFVRSNVWYAVEPSPERAMALSDEDVAESCPSLRAALNVSGSRFDPGHWQWSTARRSQRIRDRQSRNSRETSTTLE
jgi:hypothetical protein